MTCHESNAIYVKRWRKRNKERFAEQHREHSRAYYSRKRKWQIISKNFLAAFKDFV